MSKNKAALTFGILSVCCTCMIGGAFMLAKLMYDESDDYYVIKKEVFNKVKQGLANLGGNTVEAAISKALKERDIDISFIKDLEYVTRPYVINYETGEVTTM